MTRTTTRFRASKGVLALATVCQFGACSSESRESVGHPKTPIRTVRIEVSTRKGDRARLGLQDATVALVGLGAFDASGRKILARQLEEGVNEIELPMGQAIELRSTLFFLKDDGAVFLSTAASKLTIDDATDSIPLAFGPWQKNGRRNVYGLVLRKAGQPASGASVTMVEPYSQAVVAAPGEQAVAKADDQGRFAFSYPFPLDETRSRLSLRIAHTSGERNVEAAPAALEAQAVALPPLLLDGSQPPAFGGSVDFDGDGDDDATELRLGSNPFDPVSVVRKGDKGDKGESGTPGVAGASGVVLSERFSSDPACPSGGSRLRSFLDKNGNGTFEDGLDGAQGVTVICDGAGGGGSALAVYDANNVRLGAALQFGSEHFLQVGAQTQDRASLRCTNGWCEPNQANWAYYPSHNCSGAPASSWSLSGDAISEASNRVLHWYKEGLFRFSESPYSAKANLRSKRMGRTGECQPFGMAASMATYRAGTIRVLVAKGTTSDMVMWNAQDATAEPVTTSVTLAAPVGVWPLPTLSALPNGTLVATTPQTNGGPARVFTSSNAGQTWTETGSEAYPFGLRFVSSDGTAFFKVESQDRILVSNADFSAVIGNYSISGSYQPPNFREAGGRILASYPWGVALWSNGFAPITEPSLFSEYVAGFLGGGLASNGDVYVVRSNKKIYKTSDLSNATQVADLASVPGFQIAEPLASGILGTASNEALYYFYRNMGMTQMWMLKCPLSNLATGCTLRDLRMTTYGRIFLDEQGIAVISDEGALYSADGGATWRSRSFVPNSSIDAESSSWRVMEQVPFANYGDWAVPLKIK